MTSFPKFLTLSGRLDFSNLITFIFYIFVFIKRTMFSDMERGLAADRDARRGIFGNAITNSI